MKFSFPFKFKERTVKYPIAIKSICEIDNKSKCSKCTIYIYIYEVFISKSQIKKNPIKTLFLKKVLLDFAKNLHRCLGLYDKYILQFF